MLVICIGVVVSAFVILSIFRLDFLAECLTTLTNCLLNYFALSCCVIASLLLSNLVFMFGAAS